MNESLYLGVNVIQLSMLIGDTSRSNWNLDVLVFEKRGKLEYTEKNLTEQGREPTTNSTHIRCQDRRRLNQPL